MNLLTEDKKNGKIEVMNLLPSGIRYKGWKRERKSMKKYIRVLITVFLILTAIAGLSLSAFAFDNTGNTQIKDDLQAVADGYYLKVDEVAPAEIDTYNVVYGYVVKIDTLRQQTDRDTTAEMELEYHKGVAAGILSWIYFSHSDEIKALTGVDDDGKTDAEMIAKTYYTQLDTIDNATTVEYFTGKGVIACYSALLQDIYSRRIEMLRAEDNGNGFISAIVDKAKKGAETGCAYSETSGEDAENCKEFYANTVAKVELQKLRNVTISELEAVAKKVYPNEGFDMSEDGKYKDFFTAINYSVLENSYVTGIADDADAIDAFNKALGEAVEGLLATDENAGAYKKAYHSKLISKVNDRITLANTEGAVIHATVRDLFENYSLDLAKAEAKDELVAYGQALGSDSKLNDIIDDYTGTDTDSGILDNAADDNAVASELFKAKTRCYWYDVYRDALAEIDGYLGEGSEKAEDAKTLYGNTDTAIVNGERSEGEVIEENLADDIARMNAIVAEAEAERFTRDHKDIIEKTDVGPEDKTDISKAIADAEKLSADAEKLLADTLNDLGEKYKEAITEEIYSHVTEDGAKELRQADADTLAKLVEDIPAKDENGNFALAELEEKAKEYLEKSEQIKELYDGYCSEYLAGGDEYFGETAKKIATDGAKAIIEAPYDSEGQIKNDTVTELKRLAALEDINESAKGYETVGDIPEILESSKEEIKERSADDDIDGYAKEKMAEIAEIIRQYELENATDALEERAEEIKNAINGYEFISDEQRQSLLDELDEITEAAKKAVEDAPDGEAVKTALSDAKAKLDALEEKADKTELDACLASVIEALNNCYGEKGDYSAENYLAIVEIIDGCEDELAAADSVADYVEIRDRGIAAVTAVEDLLETAKREGEERLTAAYEELLKKKHCYSADGLAELKEIYTHSLDELRTSFTEVPEDAERATAFVDERIALMKGVKLEKIYTADGLLATDGDKVYPDGYDSAEKGYIGALWSESGIPSDTELFIGAAAADGIAEQIKNAVKNKLVLVNGSAAERNVLKALKNCNVILGAEIKLGDILPRGGKYRVSILLPDSAEMSDVLGVVFIREDGGVEFYEITPDSSVIEFETTHFSKYYVVSRGEINLIPLIVCLSIIILCELCVLAILIIRRRKREATALCGIAPIALAVKYRPAGGNVIAILLGAAVIVLGAAIGYLVYLEIKEARKPKKAVKPKPEKVKKPIEATVPTITEPEAEPVPEIVPLESVTVEEAEELLSDTQAQKLQEENAGYEDTEIYHGEKKAEINIDTISEAFGDGETVTLNSLKEKKLVSRNAGQVKILARGSLNKKLRIVAQDFSGAAVKMILLTGGEAIVTYPSAERGGRREG